MDIEAATRLRVAVSRLARRLRPTAAAGSLTTTEVEVLAAAGRLGPIKLSELALLAGLNPTMLSRVVGHLEDLGLLERHGDESDRRVCRVAVSRAGAALHERVRTERTAVLFHHVDRLSPHDKARLLAALPVLERLSEALLSDPTCGDESS